MKAADLRKSILQAAVQGKLVPQDKNDEPASELLKRIQAEKAALVKNGKLKKEKPLPAITEDEIPYDLPDGWEWCRLGDVGITNIGLTYKPSDISSFGTPVLRSGNIRNGEIDLSDLLYVSCDIPEKQYIEPGDILICARNGSKRLVGKSAIVQVGGMSFGAFMAIFRSIINPYIHKYLNSPIFMEQMHGNSSDTTTINQITQSMLKLALCPLPPFAEQQHIVAKVDELMTMCDELEAAEKELDALESHFFDYLPKSILQAAVQGKLVPQDKNDEPASELLKRIQAEKAVLIKEGKLKKEKPLPPITEDEIPYDLPDGWVWCRLGELIAMADNNNIQKNLPPSTIVNYVDIDAIDNKLYRIKATKIIPVNQLSTRARRVLSKGMIVYSLVRPYLDNIAVIENDEERLIGSTGFAAFRTIVMPKEYLFSVLLCPYTRERFVSLLSGFNSPSISQTDFISTLFPLPPLAEQQRIVAKVDELMAMCDELKRVAEQPINHDNVMPFPAESKENIEPIAMAARGEVEGMSDQAKQAIEDLFGEDE